MIKNIVFDMGNVILRWDPHYIASKLSNDSLEQEVIERELFCFKTVAKARSRITHRGRSS